MWILPWTLLAAAAAAGVVSLQTSRLRHAITLGRRHARETRAFATPDDAVAAGGLRVLVLGDSTGVGVGAVEPRLSLAGLLARDQRGATIVNLACNGARIADLPAQLDRLGTEPPRFDLILVHAGGNDVLRPMPRSRVDAEVRVLLRLLQRIAPRVVWLGPADVGLAPAFVPPLSWWLGLRSRRLSRLIGAAVRGEGAQFVDFSHRAHSERFARRRSHWFFDDGLHPSAASYRYCYRVLRRGAALGALPR